MLKKTVLLAGITAWSLCCCAWAATESAEFVKNFYENYTQKDASLPSHNVSEDIMNYIDNGQSGGIDYFTKMGTDFIDWSTSEIMTHAPIHAMDNVDIVPITFQTQAGNFYVIVYVKKERNSLMIIKISDIYPYS